MWRFELQFCSFWAETESWKINGTDFENRCLTILSTKTIPWTCYERNFNEFYLSVWNQLVFLSKASVVCSVTTVVFIDFCLKKLNAFSQHILKKWVCEFCRTNHKELKCYSSFCVNYSLRYYLMMQHQPIVKRVNGAHEWVHRPYQLLSAPYHCCLYKHRRQKKATAPEQLTSAHLYLCIAKSGYLFHGYSGGMLSALSNQWQLDHQLDQHLLPWRLPSWPPPMQPVTTKSTMPLHHDLCVSVKASVERDTFIHFLQRYDYLNLGQYHGRWCLGIHSVR